ncbi:MAG: carboxymuconolactone decarboxylase family protein [Microthrixaceae bacterium]
MSTPDHRSGTDEPQARTPAYERGAAKIREVYAGHVVDMPEGTMAFNDVMMRSLFAEVWDRDVLSIDSRRLLLMGVIAARGQVDTWRIQARASLDRGELTAEQLRETLVMLAPYAGYPVVAPLIVPTEEVIAEFTAARGDTAAGEDTSGT